MLAGASGVGGRAAPVCVSGRVSWRGEGAHSHIPPGQPSITSAAAEIAKERSQRTLSTPSFNTRSALIAVVGCGNAVVDGVHMGVKMKLALDT